MSSSRTSSSIPAAVPVSPATHVLVFTTDMANEAAVKYQRSKTRLPAYHASHPHVQSYMLRHGMVHAAAVAAVAGIVDGAPVTQEQLENRKSKMATLERIHNSLTKNKNSAAAASSVGTAVSTPVSGVNAMQQQHSQQQQQMYVTTSGGQMGGPGAFPCPGGGLPPQMPMQQQHDVGTYFASYCCY